MTLLPSVDLLFSWIVCYVCAVIELNWINILEWAAIQALELL